MVASPTSTGSAGETAIFLPNTTRFLERLKEKQLSGLNERQRVPISTTIMSNADVLDDMKLIESPRMRKIQKAKRKASKKVNGARNETSPLGGGTPRSLVNNGATSPREPATVNECLSLVEAYPGISGAYSSKYIVTTKDASGNTLVSDDVTSLLGRIQYRTTTTTTTTAQNSSSGGAPKADSILQKVKVRRQQRKNDQQLRVLAEIDVDSFYSVSFEEEEEEDTEKEEDDVEVYKGEQEEQEEEYEGTVYSNGLPDVVSDLSVVSARDRHRPPPSSRFGCGFSDTVCFDSDEIAEMDRFTPKCGGEGQVDDSVVGGPIESDGDNVRTGNAEDARRDSAERGAVCGAFDFGESEDTTNEIIQESRQDEAVETRVATPAVTPKATQPFIDNVSSSVTEVKNTETEQEASTKRSIGADLAALLLIEDDEFVQMKKNFSCW